MAAKTKRVTLAADWTTADGKFHKGGVDIALPAAEARNLVYRGKARYTEDVKAGSPELPALDPQGKTDEKKK